MLVAMYLVAATMLWIVARQSGVSYKRVLCAVAIMIPLSFLIGSFQSLNVHLGTVIDFSLDFLVVFILTRTSFWRSLFAAAAYWGTLFLANLGLALLYAE
jgi:Na+/H+ antiporter NhaA